MRNTLQHTAISTLALALTAVSPALAQQNNSEDFATLASQCYELRIVEEKLDACDRALLIAPTGEDTAPMVANVWHTRGEILDELGRYRDAVKSFKQALLLDETFVEAWNNLGAVLYALGEYNNSLTAVDQALALNETIPEAWYNKGNALDELGRYQEAIEAFDRAIELRPNYASAWNNRGISYAKLEDYTTALESFQRALDIDPTDADVQRNIRIIRDIMNQQPS